MPIANHRPDVVVPNTTQQPDIADVKIKDSFIDTRDHVVNSIMVNIDGYPWIVDFLIPIVGNDSAIVQHDVNKLNTYQTYEHIKNVELRVDSPITPNYNSNDDTLKITGEAHIVATIIPNVGAMFIADGGYNNKAVYVVTNVERKTLSKASVYRIEYSVAFYVRNDEARFTDLLNKVVRTKYFHRDRFMRGDDSVVLEEEHESILYLKYAIGELIEYYFESFFDKQTSTLLIPDPSKRIYDSFIIDFVTKLVTTFDTPLVSRIRKLNTEADTYLSQDTVLDVIYKRQENLLFHCNDKMGLASVEQFSYRPELNAIRYTGVTDIVYPEFPDTTVTNRESVKIKRGLMNALSVSMPPKSKLNNIFDNTTTIQGRVMSFIPPVHDSDYYIFTQAFYNNQYVESLLESITLDFIRRKKINPTHIKMLVERYRAWGRIEQFYYLPILLLIMRSLVG